jgi:hypothetical protein
MQHLTLPGRARAGRARAGCSSVTALTKLLPLRLSHGDLKTLFVRIVLELIQRHGDVIGANAQNATSLNDRNDLGLLLAHTMNGVRCAISHVAQRIRGTLTRSFHTVGYPFGSTLHAVSRGLTLGRVANQGVVRAIDLTIHPITSAVDSTIDAVHRAVSGAARPSPIIHLATQEALAQLRELRSAELDVMNTTQVLAIGAVNVLANQVVGRELVVESVLIDYSGLLHEILLVPRLLTRLLLLPLPILLLLPLQVLLLPLQVLLLSLLVLQLLLLLLLLTLCVIGLGLLTSRLLLSCHGSADGT